MADYISVSFPFGGLDVSGAFAAQRRMTTPQVVNVRPFNGRTGRRQGSRRPGLVKHCPQSMGGHSVQDINAVVVSRSQITPKGDMLTTGSTGTALDIRDATTGGATAVPTALAGNQSLACIDNAGAFYVASVGTGLIRVRKISSTGSAVWSVDMTATGTGSGLKLWGLGALDNVVYVWVVDATAPGIYRFSAGNGARLDPGPWIDTNGGLVSATATPTRAYQCMAIGGSLVGVVGGKDNKLLLQLINAATGQVTSETTLQDPFVSYQARVVADQGGNYYVLTNASGAGVNKLMKVDWSGTLVAAFGTAGAVTSTTSGARDIAYEPTTFSICVVGNAIFPNVTGATADDSYQRFGAVDGVLVNRAKPSNVAWDAVCADGLGSMRLRRSVAAGNTDLISLTVNGVTTNWTAQTNRGVTTDFLWLQCTGDNLAPYGSASRPTRIHRKVAVAGGTLYQFNRSARSVLATNFCDGSAPVVFSTVLGGKLYFADGTNYRTYDGEKNVSGTLTATAGSLPASSSGRKCTLIETWRGRLVLAGLEGDRQNWFMSAVFDPGNFDYNPAVPLATQAVAGANAPAGKCPDVVNGIVPLSDDLLIFLCDHSVWQMTGDPAEGGRFDLISAVVGGAWGRAWTVAPDGTLYFFGQRGGVYRMRPGAKPTLVSAPINDRLMDVDLSKHIVRMVWDDEKEGCHLFITPLAASEATTHYWFDEGREVFQPATAQGGAFSWWPDEFANTVHNPMAVYLFDGDAPDDRVILMGGRDGFIREWSDTAKSDDGVAIQSEVYLSLVQRGGNAFRMQDLQCTLWQNSSDVDFSVHVGESAEAASHNPSSFDGTFIAGRNYSQPARVRGHAMYIRLHSSALEKLWSLDSMLAVIETLPKTAQRVFYRSPAPVMSDDTAPVDPTPTPGTLWTPDLLGSRLTLWAFASDLDDFFNDGDKVSELANYGSAGGTLFNENVSNAPWPSLEKNEVNGKSALRFDGVDDYFAGLPISAYITASAYHAFIVAKGASNVSNLTKGFWTDAGGFAALLQKNTGAAVAYNWDGNADTAEAPGTLNVWTLYTSRHGAGMIGVKVNGGTEVTAASGNTSLVSGLFYLGRYQGQGFLQCDIAEVAFINEYLSAADAALMEGYLAWKYGLQGNLPMNHPYKAAAPTV